MTNYNNNTYPAVALLEVVLERNDFELVFPDKSWEEALTDDGFQYSWDAVLTAPQAELLNRHVHQVKLLVLPRQ